MMMYLAGEAGRAEGVRGGGQRRRAGVCACCMPLASSMPNHARGQNACAARHGSTICAATGQHGSGSQARDENAARCSRSQVGKTCAAPPNGRGAAASARGSLEKVGIRHVSRLQSACVAAAVELRPPSKCAPLCQAGKKESKALAGKALLRHRGGRERQALPGSSVRRAPGPEQGRPEHTSLSRCGRRPHSERDSLACFSSAESRRRRACSAWPPRKHVPGVATIPGLHQGHVAVGPVHRELCLADCGAPQQARD